MATISPEELARRKAQSKRDKEANKQKQKAAAKPAAVPKRPRHPTDRIIDQHLTVEQHLNKQVLETVGALINPDEFPPFRLPDGGRPTAVASLRLVDALAADSSDTTVLTRFSGLAIARRDPRCALIEVKTGQNGCVYDLAFRGGSFACPDTGLAGTPLVPQILSWNSGAKRHGDYMVPWVFADGFRRFWFQSAGISSQIVVSSLTPGQNYTLHLEWLCGKATQADDVMATANGSGVAIFDVPMGRMGYVTLTPVVVNWVAGFSVKIFDNSTTAVCHLAAPGFWDAIADIDAIRVNSMSLMYSDRTNMLTTQGDIVAYQCSGGISWDELMRFTPLSSNVDPYSAITSFTKNCYKGEYKNGRYLPAKSSADPRESDLIDIGDASGPWDIEPIMFSEQLNYLVIAFNSRLQVGGTVSLIGEWTYCAHVEYETESQWRMSLCPTMHPDILKEAKHAIAAAEFDFENPKHLAKIWKIVKNVGRLLLPYASAATVAIPNPAVRTAARLGLDAASVLIGQ